MDTIIVAIGDEVVCGQTVNSNATRIASALTQFGLNVKMHLALTDDIEQLKTMLPSIATQCSLIVTTGGLGPTTDDRTRSALTQAFGWKFTKDEQWFAHLKKVFSRDDHALSSQALVPEGAIVLQNPEGTACGFMHQYQSCWIVVLPGVPGECAAMLTGVKEQLSTLLPASHRQERLHVHFFGVYERFLDYQLQQAVQAFKLQNLSWGLYPNISTVMVVLHGPLQEQLQAKDWLIKCYPHKHYSGNLIADLRPFVQKTRVFIEESITAGLMRWQASQETDINIDFESKDNHQWPWHLKMIQEAEQTIIKLLKEGALYAEHTVPHQGSLKKQQERLATLGFGLLLETLQYGTFHVAQDPTVLNQV
jgi:molybdenum cofactor synthesis domain-containing protein